MLKTRDRNSGGTVPLKRTYVRTGDHEQDERGPSRAIPRPFHGLRVGRGGEPAYFAAAKHVHAACGDSGRAGPWPGGVLARPVRLPTGPAGTCGGSARQDRDVL